MVTLLGAAVVVCLAQVNTLLNWSPWEKRFVALACSESYQVLPSGAHNAVMLLNCGKGRSDCATVAVTGNPVKGGLLNPREIASAELSGEASSCTSAGLLMFNPAAAIRCGVNAFTSTIPGAFHHTPRLAT